MGEPVVEFVKPISKNSRVRFDVKLEHDIGNGKENEQEIGDWKK